MLCAHFSILVALIFVCYWRVIFNFQLSYFVFSSSLIFYTALTSFLYYFYMYLSSLFSTSSLQHVCYSLFSEFLSRNPKFLKLVFIFSNVLVTEFWLTKLVKMLNFYCLLYSYYICMTFWCYLIFYVCNKLNLNTLKLAQSYWLHFQFADWRSILRWKWNTPYFHITYAHKISSLVFKF